MDAICIATLAWIDHRAKSELLLARLAAAATDAPKTLQLDLNVVLRDAGDAAAPYTAMEIPLADWIRDGVTEDGVLEIEAIRAAAHTFPVGGTVLINAAGYKSDIVVAALHQARHALYPLRHWPALFVVVIDDAQLFQVSGILSTTFQLQPNVQPTSKMARETRQFMQYARLLRLFGRNVGPISRALRWRIDAKARRTEYKINRGLGWTWEE
jgi:hypothetical protein